MDSNLRNLKAALLAMEPASTILALARQYCGGSIAIECQTIILEHFIMKEVYKSNVQDIFYAKSILKNVILAVESTDDTVDEGLYEHFSLYLCIDPESYSQKDESKICKSISFYLLDRHDDMYIKEINLVATLKSSLNLLEGDTGCTLWPSGLFLSEFILSYPSIFSNRICFEVGSGIGLTGVSLSYVGASKIILTDGNESSLRNMESNMNMNQLPTKTQIICKLFPWETASKPELESYGAEIVLGADVIYDPQYVPHLVRVLSVLLNSKSPQSCDHPEAITLLNHNCNEDGGQDIFHHEPTTYQVAYIASVIRNPDTFLCFGEEASKAHLFISEVTEILKPLNLLPYMLSYDRSLVRLFRVSAS